MALADSIAAAVSDGAIVATGGGELSRKPVAAIRELVTLGRRELVLVTLLGSIDVELLLAAGAVGELHSAGVALQGLAPHYRTARQEGTPPFVEWSEGTFVAALQAAALGLDSTLWRGGLGTDLPAVNKWLREISDPHTGAPVLAVKAVAPDVALLHVPAVDEEGNAYCEGDLVADALLSRAAKHVIVTYEQKLPVDESRVAISRLWINEVFEAPHGASPGGCFPHYGPDFAALKELT